MDQNPGHLLQLAATGVFGAVGAGAHGFFFQPRVPPGPKVQEPAPRTAHPGREPHGGDPGSVHRAVILHPRDRRGAQPLCDPERAPHLIHVADLTLQRNAAIAGSMRGCPSRTPGIRGPAHDGAHRAVEQQVEEPNRSGVVSHRTSTLPYPPRCASNATSATALGAGRRGCTAGVPGVFSLFGDTVVELALLLRPVMRFVAPPLDKTVDVMRGLFGPLRIGPLAASFERFDHRLHPAASSIEAPRGVVVPQVSAGVAERDHQSRMQGARAHLKGVGGDAGGLDEAIRRIRGRDGSSRNARGSVPGCR